MNTTSHRSNPGAAALYRAALVLIVLLGAALRFTHSDWDGGNQLHPDERAILFVAQTVELPSSLPEALNPARSPLNPFRAPEGEKRIFPYGHLPLYLTAGVEHVLGAIGRALARAGYQIEEDTLIGHLLGGASSAGSDTSSRADLAEARFDRLTYTGRALSALCDTLTILAVALLARDQFGRLAGLLAAAFTASAVLHIQNAHFGTVDTPLALFATLSVWRLARFGATGRLRDSLLAGVFAGLAVGSKASAVLLAVPLLVSHLSLGRSKMGYPEVRLASRRVFWLTLLAALLAFVLTNPYAFLDPAPFVSGVATQARMVSGRLDWPSTRQYIGTLPIWTYIEQQARWSLGLPLTLAAYGGLGWATRQAIRSPQRPLVAVLAWAWVYLLVVGTQQVKFPRYMLPLTPTLFAVAGGTIAALGGAGPEAAQRPAFPLLHAAAAVVLVPSGLYALAFTHMYDRPHPWVTASEWLYHNIPPGKTLAVERWDDALPLDLIDGDRIYLRAQTYRSHLLDPFAEPDDRAKLRDVLVGLAGADYLILASSRAYGVVPRLEDRYPLTAAAYRSLFAGELGYTLEESFARQPVLFGVMLHDDPFRQTGLENPFGNLPGNPPGPAVNLGPADESFTVYDHPQVLIFRNDRRLSVEKMEAAVVSHLGEAEGLPNAQEIVTNRR